jgi:elongation factor P
MVHRTPGNLRGFEQVQMRSLKNGSMDEHRFSSEDQVKRAMLDEVELSATVDLKVLETEPGLKGSIVSNVTKPAKLETGLVVKVQAFIVEGEKIRVSTAEGTYQELG